MRAIWKGAVSFGLVSIAVKLYSATEEKDIRFHQVHRTDGGRIKYQRTCSIDGEVVSFDDIAKGYDVGGGEMVILTDEDFSELPLTTSRAIDVLQFVPADDIDPIMFAKAYYLEPEGQAAKPYVLLRDALQDADRVAIVKIALRQREQLATLRVKLAQQLCRGLVFRWPSPMPFIFAEKMRSSVECSFPSSLRTAAEATKSSFLMSCSFALACWM